MSLSPGYLHSSFRLLEMVTKHDLNLSTLSTSLPRIEIMSSVDIINFVNSMGWIYSDPNGIAKMTAAGERIHRSSTISERFRQALLDYIGIYRPAWAQLTPRGRKETLSVLSPEVFQCFAEADLVSRCSDDVIGWWDCLAARARGQSSEALLVTGRQGEKLSINYEQRRTGKQPKWLSIESNLAGFDILSVADCADVSKLQIEVKTTQATPEYGRFFISRNEWETCLLACNYVFHLWALGKKDVVLAVLNKSDIGAHIPQNKGRGEWESVEIPFSAFLSDFFVPESVEL